MIKIRKTKNKIIVGLITLLCIFTCEKVYAYKEYKAGDVIQYNNELYHVITNSYASSDYVVLQRDKPLTEKELNKYGGGESDITGNEVSFYSNCDSIGISEKTCPNISYENSDIKIIIDNWSSDFSNDLKLVKNYKARIATYTELLDNTDFQANPHTSDQIEYIIEDYKKNWLTDASYWTMSLSNDKYKIYGLMYDSINDFYVFSSQNMTAKLSIKPVINLKKCVIEKNDCLCLDESSFQKKCIAEQVYKNFYIGDEVVYRSEKYYVIENSYYNKNYVTLLKADLLKLDDIGDYRDNVLKNISYSEVDGIINYTCGNDKVLIFSDNNIDLSFSNDEETNICYGGYVKSKIKEILDNWVKLELDENELVTVDGYKVRLLKIDDLVQNLNFTQTTSIIAGKDSISYKSSDNTPKILFSILNKDSFMMDISSESWVYSLEKTNENLIATLNRINYVKSSIRPVINLNKEVLGNKINYDIGEEVIYKDNKYIVIEKSDNTKNYVVLLKEKVLNNGQLISYSNNDYTIFTPYYISDKCNSSSNTSGCSTSYEKSEIKKIIDYWSKDFQDDLVSVDGNKTRIISLHDLIYNLGYDKSLQFSTTYRYTKTNDTPNWVYNMPYYCTMEPYEDSNNLVYLNMYQGYLDVPFFYSGEEKKNYFISCTVRPVINLKKCAIYGECPIEEDNNETAKIVNVDNTLSNISIISLVISSILILVGITILFHNYYISYKEKK